VGSQNTQFPYQKLSTGFTPTPKSFDVSLQSKRGFTLLEFLVSILIIGIISAIVLSNLNNARGKAREAKVLSELRSVRSAIALLEHDTQKWPNGCPPSMISNPEVNLNTAQAGIKQQPTVQDNGDGCEWTASDIASWGGPYMETPIDPWGNPYWFDPDYRPYENCAGVASEAETVTVLSFGPNGVGTNAYDCDDIFIKIR